MTSPTSVDTDDLTRATWLVAGASAAAGLIHFSVIAEHSGGEVVVPIGFAVTGVAQVGIAAALLGRRVTRARSGWPSPSTPWPPWPGCGAAPPVSRSTPTRGCRRRPGRSTDLRHPPGRSHHLGHRPAGRPPGEGAAGAGRGRGPGRHRHRRRRGRHPRHAGPPTQAVAAPGAAAPAAAGGDGHGHSHGGAAAATTASAAPGDHSADMLRIDRARCDLAFHPRPTGTRPTP